ncbi:efflux RND transporter periplasmic adaptor subunit [Roseococcus microcysteis]|uniref:efflux RND transporter periplasmic adaptor subunit n=1 Tax=Roseococcus microcysteis TaxID=2771361 RepID=UPI00168AEC8E|nr:efflux RND transporter periplasmic adaptor subunit [Roseococcus microcysteis]
MFRRRLLLPALLLLAAGGAWAWFGAPPRLAMAPVTTGPALEAVYATGSVEPVQMARVGPATRGRLTALLVDEGQRVTEGQPMARLDDRQTRALAEEAEARARFAQDDLARTRALVTRDIAARATLDRAERDAEAARATAEAARQRLDDHVVRAPAGGVVLRRDGEVGEVVDTPTTLFWIGEIRPLRVTAEVDEEDIARVMIGQPALLRADAFPGRVLRGEVAQITPRGDTTRKAYRVRLALSEDTPLMVGMTVEANIVLREASDALLVPPAAVALDPDSPPGRTRRGHVWLVREGRLERRAVLLGVQGARAVEVLEGLARGDSVVAEARPSFREGQRVRAP